ncbi:hypothetical protein PSI22_16285 [Xenorhabdus sp. XENO-7]|uniref:Uncharacterized protein n=1 Tax=Xenorhabdus aichiensis TaxID=3025874 RepID=A0ABT5MA72_9GAMM|nr:hypothetical protein [Xenorhabdus aichiensis]MDC9623156.1 hypothetical protein [Xenorhabdus aichiensis]
MQGSNRSQSQTGRALDVGRFAASLGNLCAVTQVTPHNSGR